MRKYKTKLALLIAILLLLIPLTAYAAMGGTTSETGSQSSSIGGSYSSASSASSAMHDAYSSGADMTGGYWSYPGGGASWGSGLMDGATVDFGTVDQGGDGGAPACHDYTVPVSAPDYEVAEAGPSVMRKGYQALVYVNVKNIGQLTGKANVSVKINGEVIGDMTTITIPAGGTHTISYGHYTPRTTGKIQMEVMVNPNHPTSTAPRTTTVNSCYGGGYTLEYGRKGELSPAEYSYSNNKLTQNILVSKYPDVPIVTVDAPRPPALTEFISKLPEIDVSPTNDWPDPPDDAISGGTPGVLTPGGTGGDPVPIGNNKTRVTWIDSKPTGSDVTYYAKQEMTVKVLDRGLEMTTSKSGYGFELQVEVKVSTDYPTEEKLTAPKKVILYLPDAGDYETAVELVRTDHNGTHVPPRGTLKTTWELPVNAKSGAGAKKWYIPEWWPDASDYSFLVKAKGTYTPGGEISSAAKKVIRVDGNLYTDDYTPGG